MTCKPRQITGNLPLDAISKDYNRYCDRIIGNEIPGGFVVTNINIDGNIVITFSEEVTGVTNVGDCVTGSLELYNDTQTSCTAGALSTSDDIQYTFDPTVDFTVGDALTLTLTSAIETVANKVTNAGNDYTCILDNIAVEPGVTAGWATYWQDDGVGSSHAAWSVSVNYSAGGNPYEGPFEFKYRVVNRLPTMDTFTIDATSVDANIGILTATGTDLDGHTLTFGISLANDSSTVALYQNEAAWQGAGFDSGLPEGTDASIPLYCFAKDTEGGISLVSISDTCAVDIPDTVAPVMTAFTVEPTSVVANIEILTLLATDLSGSILYQVNEVATIPDAGIGTWQSAAAWIAAGYDSSVSEGSPETVQLYGWAKDSSDNVSTAPTLTDSCDVTITHAPTFSVQPVINTELYDGGTFDFTVADVNPAHTVDVQSWNGSIWATVLTNVAIGAKVGIEVSDLAAGTIDFIKFRVADTGETDYTESNTVASFDTVAPVLSSVTPGDTENTLVFADNANDTSDSFNIHWGTTTGVLTNTITGVTSPYDHTSLTNGTEYFYETVAIKGGLESTASAEDSGTPDIQIEPVVDWDASVTSSMLQTVGGIPVENLNDPVRNWLDQSPEEFDLTAEPNGEPVYIPGIQNGLAGVLFGHDLDIWMRNALPLLTDDAFTMYIVQKATLSTVTQVIIAQHKLVSADAGRYQIGPNSGAASYAVNRFFHEESGSGYSLDTTDTAFDATAHIIMISGDGAGNFITSVDGGTEQSLASPTWTPLNTHTTIGAQVDPANLSNSANLFIGHLFQLVDYDYQRDTGTRASDISALMTKWGIV